VPFLQSRSRIKPLPASPKPPPNDAVVRLPDDPTFARVAEVVLVNTAAITAIDPMLALT
jgi:hypothetical protein